jgi:hypothetical protein
MSERPTTFSVQAICDKCGLVFDRAVGGTVSPDGALWTLAGDLDMHAQEHAEGMSDE